MPDRRLRSTKRLTLDGLRAEIRKDFLAACASLYWLKPRGKYDPETGEEIPGEAGLRRVELFPEQRRQADIMLAEKRANRPVRTVKVKPRQSGDSTYAELYQFHEVYWDNGQGGLTIAHHDTTTASLYGMAQTFFTELPPELQIQPKKLNRKELAWDKPYNNTIIAQTAGFVDIGHGLTINHVHLSEIDLYPDPETVLEGIMETVALAPGTTIQIESKAQGTEGWLYGFWNQSKAGKTGFIPIFTAWYQVPEYRLPVPRDFEPTREEMEWIEEYHISHAQLMWYRAKRSLMIAKEPWGGDRRMKSSYPFTDDEAFQSSGFCVFPDGVLARLKETLRPPLESYRLVHLPDPGEFGKVPALPHEADLWIWKKPEPGRYYSLGVDISDGVGETESVVTVCAYPDYEQVAEWASKHSSVEETAYVARYLAQMFHGQEALIIPEINRNGNLILYLLNNMPGDFSIFRWRYLDKLSSNPSHDPKLGWETNANTKKNLVQVANLVFIRGQGAIRSPILHEQMTRCLDILPGKRWAAVGGKSDRIIAWLIAMMGAYLDFEGGSVGGFVSERHDERQRKDAQEKWIPPGYYDANIDELFEDAPMTSLIGSNYRKEDFA